MRCSAGVVAVGVVVVLAGCGRGGSEQVVAAGVSSPVSAGLSLPGAAGSSTGSSVMVGTEVPSAVPGGVASTSVVSVPVRDLVAIDEVEGADGLKACIGVRLPVGTDRQRVPAGVAEEVLAACSRDAVFGEAWVDGLRESRGAVLTEEQYGCLRAGYLGLSVEELAAVQRSVTAPGGEADRRAAEVLAVVFGACRVGL